MTTAFHSPCIREGVTSLGSNLATPQKWYSCLYLNATHVVLMLSFFRSYATTLSAFFDGSVSPYSVHVWHMVVVEMITCAEQ